MKLLQKITALFGIKTMATLQAENPHIVFSEVQLVQLTDYIWANSTSRLYALGCLGYGFHSLIVKGSILGMVLALIGALFFYGLRGSKPAFLNK